MYSYNVSKRMLTVKELIKIIDDYSLENCTVSPFASLRFGSSNDDMVVIHTLVDKDRKHAYYNYPENWKSLKRSVLKESIKYDYMKRYPIIGLQQEKDVPDSVVTWDPIPYSQVEIVPNRVYDIYTEIEYEFDEY